MTKDPAVLFYTSDFLTGTFTMSNEHTGMYIKLLCLQHQRGRLTERDMINVCLTYVEDVYCKFIKDEDGLYYNKRMEDETNRRRSFCESRRLSRMSNVRGTHVQRMETENINTTSSVCNTTPESGASNQEQVKYNTDINICLVDDVIDDLNAVLGVNYKKSGRKTRELIGARIKDGFGLEDFKAVHRKMYAEWGKNTEMQKYLRPITLYCVSKFESYLNRPVDKYSGMNAVQVSILKMAERNKEKICSQESV